MSAVRRNETLTIRLDPAIRELLEQARSAMPYKPTITSIVERGIALAIDEMERITKAAEDVSS